MESPFWYYLADAVQNGVTTTAIIVTGCWVIYRFWIRRENQTAIEIGVQCASEPYGEHHVVFVSVMLSNKGTICVTARTKTPAYEDKVEVLKYAGHIRLRPIPTGEKVGTQIEWFPLGASPAPRGDDIEADFLAEYAVDGHPRFWMEPGETYQLGATIVLAAGNYMGMATFIGNRGDEEFWRHLFFLQVPATEKSST